MKFLPSPSAVRRVVQPKRPPARGASGETLGRGMDTVITLVVFLGIGWLLDRWLGTTPWFMIGLFLLAAAGSFVVIKARYTAQMEALEAERIANRRVGRTSARDIAGHGRSAADVPTMQASRSSARTAREPAAS